MAKRAFITGITGQDGAYLGELLLSKGYEVHGALRRASLFNTDRIDHLYHDPHVAGVNLTLHYGDLSDGTSLRRMLEKVEPDEIGLPNGSAEKSPLCIATEGTSPVKVMPSR